MPLPRALFPPFGAVKLMNRDKGSRDASALIVNVNEERRMVVVRKIIRLDLT